MQFIMLTFKSFVRCSSLFWDEQFVAPGLAGILNGTAPSKKKQKKSG